MLSGTPALSRPIELYTQVTSLDRHFGMSLFDFGKRYCAAVKVHMYIHEYCNIIKAYYLDVLVNLHTTCSWILTIIKVFSFLGVTYWTNSHISVAAVAINSIVQPSSVSKPSPKCIGSLIGKVDLLLLHHLGLQKQAFIKRIIAQTSSHHSSNRPLTKRSHAKYG